jgi:DNA-binding NtrC family response regulator
MNETKPLVQAGLPIRRVRVVSTQGKPIDFVAEGDTMSIGSALGNDLRIDDPTVSRFHAQLTRKGGSILVKDLGSTNGTQIGPARLQGSEAEVKAPTVIGIGQVELKLTDADVVMVDHGPRELGNLKAAAPLMRRLLAKIQQAAKSEVSVLVLGESGTGKELVGQALHEGSARAKAAMVTVDCGALSPTLFSSELFGHEKGAFTGAHRQHLGAFERAAGGTVFLDEVGELSAELQSALLGVLERRTLRRLGGSKDIPVDVRLVSATSRDLLKEVNQGRFRLDLFYRLAVVRLDVPPLRQRPEDIVPLVQRFLEAEGHGKRFDELFPPAAQERMRTHDWPGNVRELRNIVLGTLALGQTPDFVSVSSQNEAAVSSKVDYSAQFITASGIAPYKDARRELVDEFERSYLVALLKVANGNVREAARRAQMNRSYLIELLQKHALSGEDI